MKSILIKREECPSLVLFFLSMASQIDHKETLDFIDDDFQNDDFDVFVG